jgi:acyl carrier protein
MKIKKDIFFEELLECMEIDPVDINEDTVFRELEDFDSMAVMSIVAYADEKFEKTLSAEQLQDMKTVRDLMELIGMEHFE